VLRVTTLYASSAAATAGYYTKYLVDAPGEVPGVWTGDQAATLGLSGTIDAEALELLLSGFDPVSGSRLGGALVDRVTADGRTVRAVAGFDATFSAPKSVSVWWALTGDPALLAAHDTAVAAALAHLERFGSTTRVRSNGRRLHPDSQGLTVGVFRQTTSRLDDPQLHTHAVVSAKVQTPDGRWLALDARYLKRNQRVLGGIYQAVLRAELTGRFGVAWTPVVNGQAELAGMPAELSAVFSKRTDQVNTALEAKIVEFRDREGRDPTRWERAALTREAAVDTRGRKTGTGVTDLRTRWRDETAAVGFDADQVTRAVRGERAVEPDPLTVDAVVEALSVRGSTWTRADVMRAICDLQPPVPGLDGTRWATWLEQACDEVIGGCVDLDPTGADLTRRSSDGRSVWLEPTSASFTSNAVLAEEEWVLTWATAAQDPEPAPSDTVAAAELDVMQADVAAAVAGQDRLVLATGPAGTGKTRTLRAAAVDLAAHGRVVFGVAPSAKAARVLERDTGITSDTVHKLIHEHQRTDRPPAARYQLPAGATVIVDEAGMLGTAVLSGLTVLADRHRWRLVLIGDPHQLQAVGRGGLFHELTSTGRTHHLDRIHRFTNQWEAAASLQLRHGDPRAIDTYHSHGRITAGTLHEHIDTIARTWLDVIASGATVAVTASTNTHVDALNAAIQQARLDRGHIDPDRSVRIAGGEHACVGDVIVTRRNNRHLTTTTGEPVRNRELWTVHDVHADGAITAAASSGTARVVLPTDYVVDHVRLGYAATEHGNQGDTVTVGIELASNATTRRGLYVGATRGRARNQIHIVTDTPQPDAARDVLEAILAIDRADIPATTQRRHLLHTDRSPHPMPSAPPANPVRPAPPRCTVPTWFNDVRAAVERQLADAKAAEQRRMQRDVERDADLAAAHHEHRAALAGYTPWRAVIADANRELADRRDQLGVARTTFDQAPRRRRREARRHLHTAEELAAAAEQNLADIVEKARPDRQRLDTATRRIKAIESAARSLDLLDHMTRHDTRLADLETLAASLDTWEQWARGGAVDTATIRAAAIQLTGNVRGGHQLAAIVDDIEHLPNRPTPQIPPRPALRPGPELSL